MQQKSFLANVRDDNSSIERAINILAARLRNSPTGGEEDDEASAALETLRRNLQNEAVSSSKEATRLASFERWADLHNLPDLINKINAQITDFASASRAVEGFDIKFFAVLPLSNEGKQQLAATLLRLTRQYSGNYNSFWKALVDGDTETLDEVSFDIIHEENQELGAS